MLTNITAETAQRVNRYVANQGPYDACGSAYNAVDEAAAYYNPTSPAYAASPYYHPNLPVASGAATASAAAMPPAFTPYAPAASIPRFHAPLQAQQASTRSTQSHQHNPQSPFAHSALQPTMPVTVPHHSTRASPLSPFTTAQLYDGPSIPTCQNGSSTRTPHSPHMHTGHSNTTVQVTVPVYAPSTVPQYQLFVDVATGASLSIDDDAQMMSAYGIPPTMPSGTAASPTLPAVTVGYRRSSHPHGGIGYDADQVIESAADLQSPYQQHSHHAASPTVVCSPAAVKPISFTEEVEEPPHSPATAPVPISGGLEKTQASVDLTAAPSPLQRRAPTAATAPSTYSVEVRGHFGRMQTVVSHLPLVEGSHVVFEGDRGLDMGVVVSVQPNSKPTASETSSIPMIVRSPTADEVREWTEELPARAAEAAEECAAVVASMRLKMTIRGASYQLDKQKLIFFYETSEHRVDFRKLLIELFNRYRCRIWMEKYTGDSAAAPSGPLAGRQRR